MLMHIPKCFTPDLLRLLMEMGHGEELLICDANFPYLSNAGAGPVYITGLTVPQLLTEILRFFPLDQTVEKAAVVMESAKESEAYASFAQILGSVDILPRFDFYERARSAVGLIVTSDTVKGGNILLKKGVVKDEDI